MYLIGASGHAKVIVDILELTEVEIEGLFDSNDSIKNLCGYEVYLQKNIPENYDLFIAIGDNHTRKSIVKTLPNNKFSNAIHPSAILDKGTKIGSGVAIMAGAVINRDSSIGNHTIINTCSSIDHDCKLGDFVHIGPNASLCGGVIVGRLSLIGAGSTVIPNIKIGENVTVGAGAVVVENIPDNAMVVGNPAKVIKYL